MDISLNSSVWVLTITVGIEFAKFEVVHVGVKVGLKVGDPVGVSSTMPIGPSTSQKQVKEEAGRRRGGK